MLKWMAITVLLVISINGYALAQSPENDDYRNGWAALGREDYAEALRLFESAAERGHSGAQVNLGHMYLEGRGVVQDYAEALLWYSLAAEQGVATAQYSLGVMHFDGRGVPQNYSQAVRWYRLAAKQGHPHAQYNLGAMYDNGQGVAQDYISAHMWINLAAMDGYQGYAAVRDRVASRMTPEQIAEAQAMARRCVETGYQDCE